MEEIVKINFDDYINIMSGRQGGLHKHELEMILQQEVVSLDKVVLLVSHEGNKHGVIVKDINTESGYKEFIF